MLHFTLDLLKKIVLDKKEFREISEVSISLAKGLNSNEPLAISFFPICKEELVENLLTKSYSLLDEVPITALGLISTL